MTSTSRKASPASTRKAQAVQAYQQQFGKAPPSRMSAASIERQVAGSRTAPVPAAPSPRPAPSPPMIARPGSSGPASRPRVLVGYRSDAVRSAVAKLPSGQFHNYLDNRFKDRAGVAQSLREYRATLGRGAPSSLALATAKGRTAEFAVGQAGKALQKFNPYREGLITNPVLRTAGTVGVGAIVGMKATEGYLADGLRGAFRESFNTLTFGAGGKVVDKVLGKPSIGQEAEGLFGFETPGQTGARRRAETINKRPTAAGMKAIAKAEGKPKPKDVPVPGKNKRMAHELSAVVVGTAAASTTWLAVDGLAKGVSAAGQALVKAAPTIGRLAGSTAAKALPLVGIGAFGAYRAYEGYKAGGATGAAKGLASGLLSGATVGMSDVAFSAANHAYAALHTVNASASSGGPRHVWDDKARAASIAVRQAKAAANQ